jgi:hypothetical protein
MTADPYFADVITDACQDGTLMAATMYLELCTSAPSKTVAGTASGLGRVAITMADDWTSDDEGGLTNDAVLDYGTAVDPATGVHYAELYDADVDGNRYLYGTLGDTYNIEAGQPVSFPVGALTLTVIT